MGTWFDSLAKRSARSASVTSPEQSQGMTRRQVITRGAVVTGAAWTAPMLLGVRPAFAGASTCGGSTPVYTLCTDGATSLCCAEGQVCGPTATGSTTFVCDTPLGGICGNRGQGSSTCNFGSSRCNQPASDKTADPICGGPGAVCSNNEICIPGVECSKGKAGNSGDERCGGRGAICTAPEQCAGKTVNQPALTCLGSGVCG